VVVTSYEIVIADVKFLQRYTWKYIVVDEGHRLKNFNCKLLRELRTIPTANKLLLTGARPRAPRAPALRHVCPLSAQDAGMQRAVGLPCLCLALLVYKLFLSMHRSGTCWCVADSSSVQTGPQTRA